MYVCPLSVGTLGSLRILDAVDFMHIRAGPKLCAICIHNFHGILADSEESLPGM